MKKCSHCGQEVADHLEVCPNCGSAMNQKDSDEKKESGTLGILAIVFGALGGWLGLVLGIVGLCSYKKKENKRNCIIGMCLFAGWVVFIIILYVAIIGAAINAAMLL